MGLLLTHHHHQDRKRDWDERGTQMQIVAHVSIFVQRVAEVEVKRGSLGMVISVMLVIESQGRSWA